jgi:hypothetical protein
MKEGKRKFLMSYTRLNEWITGSSGNTALIALVAGHLDVSRITPCCTPARTSEMKR